jgi:hypothetical protein
MYILIGACLSPYGLVRIEGFQGVEAESREHTKSSPIGPAEHDDGGSLYSHISQQYALSHI